ncbi:MAG TPA: CvpA family protein [Flavobacteriia bacterium]|jgi:membrane protein required for colicin V production|nr:CvpA family protein [Flavobacteriia bacterium]
MNYIDIVLAVFLIYGLVKGFMKGIFVEIASLVSLLAGLYGAIHFSYFIADWLKIKVSWQPNIIQVVAFASTFLIILFLIALIGKLVTKIINAAQLGFLNKIAGGLFGAAKIALIISVVINMFSKLNDTLPFISKETLSSSVLYSPVKNFAPIIFPSILEKVEEIKESNFIKNTKDKIENLGDKTNNN